MNLRELLEYIGIFRNVNAMRSFYRKEEKLEELKREHKEALDKMQQALEKQQEASEHIHAISKRQTDDAKVALQTLRGIMRRSIDR